MMKTRDSAATAIQRAWGRPGSKHGCAAQSGPSPHFPAQIHDAKTVLSLLTNVTVFHLPPPAAPMVTPARPRPGAV
jgi:hypothetical protein